MLRLFAGVGIAVIGVASLLLSLQYGSLLTAAGNDVAIRDRYNLLSAVLGYGGVAIFFAGIGVIILAIRRMNVESRKASPPS